MTMGYGSGSTKGDVSRRRERGTIITNAGQRGEPQLQWFKEDGVVKEKGRGRQREYRYVTE